MPSENIRQSIESNEKFVKKGPIIDSLLRWEKEDIPLPEDLKENQQLLIECEKRKEIIKKIELVYSKVPVLMNTEEALEKNIIDKYELNALYFSIEELIKNDPDSRRVLLYLPFELIPNSTITTNDEIVKFSSFYKSEWKKLLQEIDLRADFVDGDIPEREIRKGNLPKISKAAHLIPKLIDRGILSIDDVFELLEDEKDSVILDSIIDTLRILAEKKYINKNNLEKLKNSKNVTIKNMAALIKNDINSEKNKKSIDSTKNYEDIFTLINEEWNEFNIKTTSNGNNLSEARTKWLSESKKEDLANKYSEMLFENIANNKENIKEILASKSLNEIYICVIIKTLEKLIQNKHDSKTAQELLFELANSNNPEVKEFLSITIKRLQSANLLSESFSNKMKTFFKSETPKKNIEGETSKLINELKKNELLETSLYPIVMVYGSHLKDYNKNSSDIDMGMFIKENIEFEEYPKIKEELEKVIKQAGLNGSVVEFWLKTQGQSIWIKDFENSDNNLGDSSITVPLTSSWFGNNENIDYLQKELLPQYLYSENKKILDFDARKIWLKDMEHNFLQYRLMHKGYKNNNLEQGGIDSKYKDEIDGESSFYDSGYRRLATKLFLEKVFLPQLKSEKAYP